MGSTERFGYEWDKFHEMLPEYEGQFLKWVAPLQPLDFRDKIVLDVGCGMGRNSYWPLTYGASKVVGIDADERTLASARRTLGVFPQAEVRHCSAYDLKDENVFDIAFSIGVIHHLEKPHEALSNMARSLKPGGTLLIWVYGYEGNEWIVKYINPIRRLLVKLPPVMTDLVSYLFAIPLFLFVKMFPQRRPYFQQLKTFRFWHTRSIVFDQLLPSIANYWTRDEALSLFNNKGLKDVRIHPVNGLSWTVIGTKV